MEMRAQGTAIPWAGPVLPTTGWGWGATRPECPSQALRAAESRKSFFLFLLIMGDGDSDDDISSFGPYTSTTLWGPQGKNFPVLQIKN